MDIKIITAIIGVCGVAVGAILQFIFTRIVESRRHNREMRTNAYIDLVKGFSLLNIAVQNKDSEKESEAINILTDAKMKIAIYGSEQVLRNLSKYWAHFENQETSEAKSALVKAISSMRREIVSKYEGDLSLDIEKLLFKN